MIFSTVLATLLLAISPAHAHDVVAGVGGFYGGLLHPVLVPAHGLALAGLGLCIGQQPPRHRAGLLALFAAGLIAGLVIVVAAFAVTDADLAVLAAAAVAGGAIVLARPLWLVAGAPLALLAGAAIELDSVPQEISMQATFLALVGSAIGAFLIVMFLSDLMVYLRRDWQHIGVRIVGSWIAASAILVLTLRLAR